MVGNPPPARADADASPRLPRPRLSVAAGAAVRLSQRCNSSRFTVPLSFFNGGAAPPPARADADTSPRIHMSSARCSRRRFSLALGPYPQRELSLTPRLGFTCPRLGAPPQRGCRAGGPGVAAGAFHWRWGHTPSFITAINDFPPVDALFWIRPSAAPAARASGGVPREPKKCREGVLARGWGPALSNDDARRWSPPA